MNTTMLPTRPPTNVAPEATRKAVTRNDETLLRQLAARPWSPASARAAQGLALDNAARRSLLDPGDPLIAVDLERAACASAALFAALAAGAGTELDVPLPTSDQSVTMTGAAPHPNLGDPIHWRTGLLAALAVRKRRAIELLAGVPLDLLQRLSPSDPEWVLRERAALQALALRRRDAPDLLVAAASAADPKTVPDFARDWVLDVVTPELQVAFRARARKGWRRSMDDRGHQGSPPLSFRTARPPGRPPGPARARAAGHGLRGARPRDSHQRRERLPPASHHRDLSERAAAASGKTRGCASTSLVMPPWPVAP
jgi:hypothetical protein